MRLICILLLCPLLAFGQSISFEEQDVPVYLPAGWSMFGYSCMDSKDVAEAFSGFEDQIVIVKDGDRRNTINKMRMALTELVIEGIETNQKLHLKILEDKGFQNIDYYIKYLEEELIE